MTSIRDTARRILDMMGRRGLGWAFAGWVASLLSALTDFVIAVVLVVLLVALGVMDWARSPSWLGLHAKEVATLPIWLGLLFAGAVRGACQLVSQQTGLALLELVRARLRMIHGYDLLMRRRRASALSDMNVITGDVIPKAADFVYYAVWLVSSLAAAGVIGIGMFAAAWQESLIGVACLCLGGITLHETNRRIAKTSEEIARKRTLIERTLVRICRNWLLIRVLNLKEREHPVYVRSVQDYYRQGVVALFYRNLSVVLPPFLGIAALSVVIFCSLRYFDTPPASVLAFIYLFIRFTQCSAEVADRIGAMSHYRAQFDRAVLMTASLPPEERTRAVLPERELSLTGRGYPVRHDVPSPFVALGAVAEREGSAEVRLINVTFAWPGAARPLFERLSLTIPKGTQFGLIGPSGSGKSTLLGLILGVLDPETGKVRINGIPSEEYVQRNSVGYVGPDPCLIHGTIRDNLLYGANRQLDNEALRKTLDAVRLDSRTLADEIQESGEGLSSGEKQRLALARALLRNPTLLVLDEIAANLDARLEMEIADILGNLRGVCTQIIVSHRPGILKNADGTLNLGENGEAR
jgi:ABC-type multidrug transport system fused ATPase/permease subunit